MKLDSIPTISALGICMRDKQAVSVSICKKQRSFHSLWDSSLGIKVSLFRVLWRFEDEQPTILLFLPDFEEELMSVRNIA